MEHPQTFRCWYRDSNYLVLLAVPDEPALRALYASLSALEAPLVATHEPDLGTALTALAAGPARRVRRALVGIPLAFTEAVV